jgi:predicted ATPase
MQDAPDAMTTTLPASPPSAPPHSPAPVWRVRLLGAFELDDGRQVLHRLRSRAAMLLLARVAMAPEREHAREEVATLLWPEADADSARSRLRQTLSLLKAVLEPPGAPTVLLADRRALRAVPGTLWCDVQAFEQATRAGRGEQAHALYSGDLLPGFYDEWVLDERGRLQALHERLPAAAGTATAPRTPGASPIATSPAPQAPRTPVYAPAPDSAASRLPQYLTRLIGADVQGTRLQTLVAEHRLVSVLGAGGCGKTRLAIEVARGLCQPMPGGPAPRFERAVFASLVGVVSATGLVDRLCAALRIESAGKPIEQVLDVLNQHPLLLVLDNCEQLDDDAAAVLAHLAEQLPDAHWLITSRRPLGLDGEHQLVLDGLELPPADAGPEQVALNPAVRLFVDRARAHRADFHVRAGNHAALAALMRWLDGLPLAIELAASHVRTLGPAELLQVLQAARADRRPGSGSLALLSRRGARGGSDPRHASMLDVVAWSWQLLPPPQRQLLLALCLLPAGATLPMAARLGADADDHLPLGQAQLQLDDLVAQSVLRTATGQDGQWRYTPQEPVREFGLASHDDAALAPLRQRVLQVLLDWAQALPATPPLPSVRDEMPNLAQVLAQAPAAGLANDAVLLVLVLQSSWGEIAVPTGVLDTLGQLLAVPGIEPSRLAAGHALAATFCQDAGRLDDARLHMQHAGRLPCPDATLRVSLLSRLSRLHWRIDRNAERARACIEEALPMARALQRANTEASLLSLEGHLLTVVDRNPQQAELFVQQALALWQRSGNRHLVNAGRYNVAVTAVRAGRPAEVLDEFVALADEARALQDWDLQSGAREARGSALLTLRRWPEAWASLRESVAVGWDGMQMLATVYALWNVAPVLARLRQGELATQTMAAAEAQWRLRFGELEANDLRDLKRMRRFARTLLGPQAARAAWQVGATRSLGDAVRALLQAPLDAGG